MDRTEGLQAEARQAPFGDALGLIFLFEAGIVWSWGALSTPWSFDLSWKVINLTVWSDALYYPNYQSVHKHRMAGGFLIKTMDSLMDH